MLLHRWVRSMYLLSLLLLIGLRLLSLIRCIYLLLPLLLLISLRLLSLIRCIYLLLPLLLLVGLRLLSLIRCIYLLLLVCPYLISPHRMNILYGRLCQYTGMAMIYRSELAFVGTGIRDVGQLCRCSLHMISPCCRLLLPGRCRHYPTTSVIA